MVMALKHLAPSQRKLPEKLSELLGTPFGTISSEAAVMWNVQRLGENRRAKRLEVESPIFMGEDIV